MGNVPLVVKLFFLYFILGLDAYPAALLGLVIHQSAFIADVTSAGFRSIPHEQSEAARATGLTGLQTFLYVLFPQFLRVTIPPFTNQAIELLKNSALVSLIGMQDLMFVAQNIQIETYRYLESFIVVTTIYVALAFAIVGLMQVLQYMSRDALMLSYQIGGAQGGAWEKAVWYGCLTAMIGVLRDLARDLEWHIIWRYRIFLLKGLVMTFVLTVVSISLGMLAGYCPGSRAAVRAALRSATRLLQSSRLSGRFRSSSFCCGCSSWYPKSPGRRLHRELSAIIALTIIAASYLAEVIRGGLMSVDRLQFESGYATGLSKTAIFTSIVLPQAVRNMLPALLATWIMLFKTTSLVYVIGIVEFFHAATIVNSRGANSLYHVRDASDRLFRLLLMSSLSPLRRLDPKYELRSA